jgi:predicted transcriptional regulator
MFDPKKCVEYVESLVQMDEVERALLVLDNVPAEFRDKPTPEMVAIRSHILAALCTTHAYLSSNLDSTVQAENAVANLEYNMRGVLIREEVRQYNEERKTPHLVDVGPGEYWIPLALKELGMQFTYWDVAIDQQTQRVAHPLLKDFRRERGPVDQPQIFLGLEIIEHLPEPRDLAVECLRHCQDWPQRIHLSTPCYTFDPGEKDWRKPCGLPHLRANTPMEFGDAASRIFPGYQWQLYAGRILSLRGIRKDEASDVSTPLIKI